MTIHYPGRGDPADTAAKLRALADDIERMTMFNPNAELDDAPVLDNWTYGLRTVPVLTGLTIGHPILGTREVFTSEVYAIDPTAWARTYSRFYRLGRPRADRQECN